MTTTQLTHFDRYRGEAATRTGPASYIDTGGDGPAALFVHGVGTSSYPWRHVIAQMAGERRCVAVDLPLHGRTRQPPIRTSHSPRSQDSSPTSATLPG